MNRLERKQHPNSLKNLTPFEKGSKRCKKNGSKGGKGKTGSKNLTTILRELLDREIEVIDVFDKKKKKIMQSVKYGLNMRLLALALKGDIKAIREIYSRIEGEPVQTTYLSGIDGNPIEMTATSINLDMTAEEAAKIYLDKLK